GESETGTSTFISATRTCLATPARLTADTRAQRRERRAQAAEEDYAEQLARQPELCGRGQNMQGSDARRIEILASALL
ncbi:unnamed protein product, partial [Effrenium voratum]